MTDVAAGQAEIATVIGTHEVQNNGIGELRALIHWMRNGRPIVIDHLSLTAEQCFQYAEELVAVGKEIGTHGRQIITGHVLKPGHH